MKQLLYSIFFSVVLCSFIRAQSSDFTNTILKQTSIAHPERYIQSADSLNSANENEEALLILNKVLSSSKVASNKNLLAKLNIVMANCYDDIQQYRKAIVHYLIAEDLLKSASDPKLMIRSDVGISGVYSSIDKNDSSLLFLKKALPIAEKEPKKYFNYLKTIYNNLGLVYIDKYNHAEALNYFYKAIAVSEKENDRDGLSSTYNNLGNLYSELLDFHKSLGYYRKSHQIRPSATTYGNLGMIFEDLGMHDSALIYTRKSIAIDTKNNDKGGLAASYTVVGNLFKKTKESDSALHYYQLSSVMAAEVEDVEVIRNNNYNIVELLINAGKYKEAKDIALKNIISIKQGDNLGFIADGYSQLKTIFHQLGDFKTAYDYQEQNYIYSDSAEQESKAVELRKIELTAEYKKKSSNDSLIHVQETTFNNLQHAQEINKQRVVLFSFIVILLLVAIFSVLVYKRYKVSIQQKEIINLQKNEMFQQKLLVEEKQKEIVDSINYAKRIQYTLLAHQDFLNTHLPQHFIFYNPKDIVSGDFYWATFAKGSAANNYRDLFYLAICDSTGHGVPGAFMSLMNIGFLSEAINEKNITAPNDVFNYVRQRLIDNLNQDGQKDGFDGVLLCYDPTTMQLSYAAANNKPVLIRNNALQILTDDRMPVGKGEREQGFNLHTVQLQAGDYLYLYTDGFADQFGGPKGKKFKYKSLNQFIFDHHTLDLAHQQQLLQNTFQQWKGDLDQVDDVCVMGIKF
ncbi:MAG: tetratricopeptide repeat protein [Bacteroidetes bacterium]|nr:tetratricopeptide repeat protein [Bacteroidota bacterium]